MGKLGPTWEGPYRVTSNAGIGVYWLEDWMKSLWHGPGMYLT